MGCGKTDRTERENEKGGRGKGNRTLDLTQGFLHRIQRETGIADDHLLRGRHNTFDLRSVFDCDDLFRMNTLSCHRENLDFKNEKGGRKFKNKTIQSQVRQCNKGKASQHKTHQTKPNQTKPNKTKPNKTLSNTACSSTIQGWFFDELANQKT